jgi:Bifunctional DNA primase/polymerase, N-terminal/Primase C terminal 1 (PriCT-1)
MSELRDYALAFAAAGFRVFRCSFPHIHSTLGLACSCFRGVSCDNPGKHPYDKGWQQAATTDPAVIEGWWWEGGRCNIGIVTGAASGIVVVDIDPRHDGDETLARLEAEHGPLPPTWRFLTGGGGEHILFAHPGGYVACSCGNADKPGKLGLGIDVKADGGFIVAPPSRHISGRSYAISVDHHPEDVRLAPLPKWIGAMLGVDRERAANGARRDWSTFANKQVIEGARNTELASLSGLLFRRLFYNIELAAQLVRSWNLTHCSPPLDESEVEQIISSIASLEAERIRGQRHA